MRHVCRNILYRKLHKYNHAVIYDFEGFQTKCKLELIFLSVSALSSSSPVILEPVMNVEVNAPMEFQVYTCKNRGVYSSIIPPPPMGGKESKDLRAREENQRKVKKKGRKEKGKERKEKGKGKGKEKGSKREGKEKNSTKGKEQKKNEGKGKEVYGQGEQCKRTEKLWDQSDNTRQKAIRGVYSSMILAQG